MEKSRDGASKAFWDATTADEIGDAVHKGLGASQSSSTLIADIMRSSSTTHVEGDATTWRVDFETGGVHAFVYAAIDGLSSG